MQKGQSAKGFEQAFPTLLSLGKEENPDNQVESGDCSYAPPVGNYDPNDSMLQFTIRVGFPREPWQLIDKLVLTSPTNIGKTIYMKYIWLLPRGWHFGLGLGRAPKASRSSGTHRFPRHFTRETHSLVGSWRLQISADERNPRSLGLCFGVGLICFKFEAVLKLKCPHTYLHGVS